MSAGKQEEGPVPGAAGGVPGAAGGVAGGASASGGDAGPGTHVHLTHEPLDLAACVAAVASPRAGATSTFIGTTRDNFDGRNVVLLEYEAYKPMAIKKLQEIIADCRARHPVLGVAVHHRLGVVPVLEASVIIAVSSEHRAEGLDAVRYLIDTLKVGVPIWKKEVYDDGSTWKANKEAATPAATGTSHTAAEPTSSAVEREGAARAHPHAEAATSEPTTS